MKKTSKDPSQESLRPDRQSNTEPPEDEAGVLPTTSWRSAFQFYWHRQGS